MMAILSRIGWFERSRVPQPGTEPITAALLKAPVVGMKVKVPISKVPAGLTAKAVSQGPVIT